MQITIFNIGLLNKSLCYLNLCVYIIYRQKYKIMITNNVVHIKRLTDKNKNRFYTDNFKIL